MFQNICVLNGKRWYSFIVVSELITKLGFKVDSSNAEKFNKVMKTTKKVMLGVVAVTGAVGYSVLKTAGEVEQMTIAFDSLLGSVEKSKAFMKDLFDFAKTTPFEVEELIGYSKGMLAVGFTTDEIITKMKYLGNIASGVGKEKLPTLLRAFKQIKSNGIAQGEDLNMLSDAGIPILAELSEMFGVTALEVKKMGSESKISFKDIDKALQNMGSGAGMFAGLMGAQMKSFFGVISNIKDAIFQLKLAIGNELLPEALALSKSFLAFIEANKELIKMKTVAWLKKVAYGLGFVYGVFKTMLPYLVKWAGKGFTALGKMKREIDKIGKGLSDFSIHLGDDEEKKDVVDAVAKDTKNIAGKIGKAFLGWLFPSSEEWLWLLTELSNSIGMVFNAMFKGLREGFSFFLDPIIFALKTMVGIGEKLGGFTKDQVDKIKEKLNLGAFDVQLMPSVTGTGGYSQTNEADNAVPVKDTINNNLQDNKKSDIPDKLKTFILGSSDKSGKGYNSNKKSDYIPTTATPSVFNTTNAPVANVTVNVPEGSNGTPEDIGTFVSKAIKGEMESMLKHGNANSGVVTGL